MALPANLPRITYSGIVHRVVAKGVDPLSVEGSLKGGGRYNRAGEFGALYSSLDNSTAVQEVVRGLVLRRVDPAHYSIGDWWDYELELKVEEVLDLTDPNVLQLLGLRKEDLVSADRVAALKIAAEARNAGYKALLVPSVAVAHGKNVVIFLDKLTEPPRVLNSRPIQLVA